MEQTYIVEVLFLSKIPKNVLVIAVKFVFAPYSRSLEGSKNNGFKALLWGLDSVL